MCLMKTPKAADPAMPKEYAAQKAPTEKDAAGAGRLVRDRMRARTSTILTGSQGVGAADTSGKKVLLGQ